MGFCPLKELKVLAEMPMSAMDMDTTMTVLAKALEVFEVIVVGKNDGGIGVAAMVY